MNSPVMDLDLAGVFESLTIGSQCLDQIDDEDLNYSRFSEIPFFTREDFA